MKRTRTTIAAGLALAWTSSAALADEVQIEDFETGEFSNPTFNYEIEFDDPCCWSIEFGDLIGSTALHLKPNFILISFNLKPGQSVKSVSVDMVDLEGGFVGNSPTSTLIARSPSDDFVFRNTAELGVAETLTITADDLGQINGKPLGEIAFVQFQAANEGNSKVQGVGAWFDNFTVVIVDDTLSAELTDFEVVLGSHIKGGLFDLTVSDDQALQTRSQFGFTAFERNLMEIIIGAQSGAVKPAHLDLTIESNIDHPTGTAKIRLKNWQTDAFESVGEYALGFAEESVTIAGIEAGDVVRNDGRIETSVKHVVFAVFSAQGFNSFFDQVRLVVE